MVISLVGLIWSGTPDDRLCIWTLYEDSKHGGNCQSSLLFAAFHRQVCNSQCVPESWVISADNTVKETKNGMTFTFFLWMLCALSNTRFWRIRTVYKLVGHTHSHVDRAFSRIRAALQGKSYITEKDMQNHIVTTLRSYSVGWDHLVAQLDFDALRTLIGIDVHNLRNVHDLELFRTEGGVFCRFKQYMSDEMWSRPRLVLTRDQVPVVARAPLAPIEHKFSDQPRQSSRTSSQSLSCCWRRRICWESRRKQASNLLIRQTVLLVLWPCGAC